jgi:tyrosyl-tRNA synthetase
MSSISLSLRNFYPQNVLSVNIASVKKLISSGGVYINGLKISANYKISDAKLICGEILVLRTGKSNYCIIDFIN